MGKATSEVEIKNMIKILKVYGPNTKLEHIKIAEKTGLTRQTVSRLIKKMEEQKIIWGYPISADLDFLNLKLYTLLIGFKPGVNVAKSLCMHYVKVHNRIKKEDMVYLLNSSVTHGKYDFLVQFVAKDLIVARDIARFIIEDFMDDIISYELMESLVVTRKNGCPNPDLNNLVKKYE